MNRGGLIYIIFDQPLAFEEQETAALDHLPALPLEFPNLSMLFSTRAPTFGIFYPIEKDIYYCVY